MQYLTREIGKIVINPGLFISLKEHSGSIPKREYFIEAKEGDKWNKKDKSYIKNLDLDFQLILIERWINNMISSEEIQSLLKIK